MLQRTAPHDILRTLTYRTTSRCTNMYYVTEHSLTLEGLEHNTTYYFEVSSTEGGTTTDDNHGEYHFFATLAIPPPEIHDLTAGEPLTGELYRPDITINSGFNVSVHIEYRFDHCKMHNTSVGPQNDMW